MTERTIRMLIENQPPSQVKTVGFAMKRALEIKLQKKEVAKCR